MTTVAVMQPGYLPWLGYFDLIRRADIFVSYDDVQFDKHGWRNRNRVKGPTALHWLTVPVRHHGQGHPAISDIRIDDSRPWRRKHLATLRQLYAKAPFVDPVMAEVTAVLERPSERLVDLNRDLAAYGCRQLGITVPRMVESSTLALSGTASLRLLALCKAVGADCL